MEEMNKLESIPKPLGDVPKLHRHKNQRGPGGMAPQDFITSP